MAAKWAGQNLPSTKPCLEEKVYSELCTNFSIDDDDYKKKPNLGDSEYERGQWKLEYE